MQPVGVVQPEGMGMIEWRDVGGGYYVIGVSECVCGAITSVNGQVCSNCLHQINLQCAYDRLVKEFASAHHGDVVIMFQILAQIGGYNDPELA